jgi:hypothetical protein
MWNVFSASISSLVLLSGIEWMKRIKTVAHNLEGRSSKCNQMPGTVVEAVVVPGLVSLEIAESAAKQTCFCFIFFESSGVANLIEELRPRCYCFWLN